MLASGKTDTSGLAGAFIGLESFPFIAGAVTIIWVVVAYRVPFLGRQSVQAIACLSICGFVALVISTTNPEAARAQRERNAAELAAARAEARAHPDPKDVAKRAEMERREKENAYGNYVPRAAAPQPAPYVPRVEPRKPDDDYSKMPEIHVSRPNGDVLLTNHSTQVLRVAATLMVPVDSRDPGCAVLRAPADATGDALVLKPRQAVTLRRRDACPGTEAAAVQLQVWNDEQQATPFRLIHER